jgi:hypothetical protein
MDGLGQLNLSVTASKPGEEPCSVPCPFQMFGWQLASKMTAAGGGVCASYAPTVYVVRHEKSDIRAYPRPNVVRRRFHRLSCELFLL